MPMPVLQEQARNAIRQRFETDLKRDVSIRLYARLNNLLYIPGRECASCEPTRQLLEEVCALSDRVDLEVIDFYGDTEGALALGVDRIPAVLIGAAGSDNVRYFGMPSGYEMQTLLDTITAAATSKSRLQIETRRQLKRLQEDVHVKVFVTPGCHYCPAVAGLAHLMALESERVTADVIEVGEFPDLARAYNVMSVPKTVINDRVQFVGTVTEEAMVERVLQAVGADAVDEQAGEASDQATAVR